MAGSISMLNLLISGVATHCNPLQLIATHCNLLQLIATHNNKMQLIKIYCNSLQLTATHCNSLQLIATHRMTPKNASRQLKCTVVQASQRPTCSIHADAKYNARYEYKRYENME